MAPAAIAVRPRVPEDLMPGTKTTEAGVWPSTLPSDKPPDSVFLGSAAGKHTSAVPRQILFGALQSPTLRLTKPIPLKTEKTKDTVSVVWEKISEFGYGATLSEAVFDFAATITELFVTLSEKESLSDDLLGVRKKLLEYIEPRTR